MVNVIGKSEEEIKLKEKVKSLERTTKEFINEYTQKSRRLSVVFFTISSTPSMIFLKPFSGLSIDVLCGQSIIELPSKRHYNFAYALAEKYEETTGEDWTLKKKYFD